MRRMLFLLFLVLVLTVPVAAQIGKVPIVRAGTPEDRALLEIDNTTDPAKKLELLAKFMDEFGQTDLVLLAYERYTAHYIEQKDYAKAFEYGEKALAKDPDNFGIMVALVRAAQEMGDASKAYDYGDRASATLESYKVAPPPAGVEEIDWRERKRMSLDRAQEQIRYMHYALFSMAYQLPDPAQKAALLERYTQAFPDSPYAGSAQGLVAAAYQQAQNYAKMLEFAQKILARDPNNLGMLLLLADFWGERNEQLDKAEEYAKRVLDVAPKTPKPEGITDEQWGQQTSVQQGLAHSALGQLNMQRGNHAQAVESFRAAAPLLKPDAGSYARNQYRLGFAFINLKKVPDARAAFTEAASVESPYKALAQQKLNEITTARAKKRP